MVEHGVITKSQCKRIEADLARQEGNVGAAVPQSIPGYEILTKLGQARWPSSTRPARLPWTAWSP